MGTMGVLIPQSKAYPTLGKEFMTGIRHGLKGHDFSLSMETIGFGNETSDILNKIEKLIILEGVDSIVALVGEHNLSDLVEKVNALQVPTVFVHLGASILPKFENNEYAFFISYDLCQSMNILGEWCVENDKKEVAVSGSFNDVGYSLIETLEKSLFKAGGEFSGHYIPPMNPREDEVKHNEAFYQSTQADLVCQLYNGIYAKENVEYLSEMSGVSNVPTFLSPFAVDGSSISTIAEKFSEAIMITSWIPFELRKSKNDFDLEFEAATSKMPTLNAVLGYEAARTVVEVLPNREMLLKGEATQWNDSPRGAGTWSKELKLTVPQYLWRLTKENDECFMEKDEAFKDKYAIATETSEGNGWRNAYLCY